MYHADDVFAVATLLMVFPDSQIIRTRDSAKIDLADIVVDVGMVYDPVKMRFDHHQEGGAGIRGNGIPYASFGLVWKEYGERLVGPEVKEIIDEKLVMPIDAPDNGVSIYNPVFKNVQPYNIQEFLYSFLTYEESGGDYLFNTFMKVVEIAKEILAREIAKAMEKVEGMKKVKLLLDASIDKKLIIMDEPLPWERVLVPVPQTLFVVYPRREENWGAIGVPLAVSGFERKKLFPLAWAGKCDEELQELTGVKDAMFCHRGRFIATARSKEGAIELAKLALNA